jgi:glycerol kinase
MSLAIFGGTECINKKTKTRKLNCSTGKDLSMTGFSGYNQKNTKVELRDSQFFWKYCISKKKEISTRGMANLVVIDAGTTGVRAVVVDKDLKHLKAFYEKIPDEYIETPESGWVQQDPEGVWQVTKRVVEQAIAFIGVKNVAGLSLTTQRSSGKGAKELFLLFLLFFFFNICFRVVLLTDMEGKPLSPFIPWQDVRSSSICDSANSSLSLKAVQGGAHFLHFLSRSPKFMAGSVWTFSPIMASTKVAWLLRNDPNLLELAVKGELQYGGLDAWLLFKLVGGKLRTDRSNLSAAGFYDPWTDGPSSIVFNLLDVPSTLFVGSEQPSASTWGTTNKHLFEGAELPVLAVVSDQGAAVMGEGCFDVGEGKITLGSGAFFSMTTGVSTKEKRGGMEVQYPSEGIYPLIAYEIGDDSEVTFMVEGSEPACGTGLDWVGKTFGLWDDISTTSDTAFSVEDAQGVTFVPALFGLRAPHNHNTCKGAFVGLTTAVNKTHLVRAVLESVCWRLFELLQALNKGKVALKSIRIDGGVSQNDFICQFLANITQMPITRGANIEATVNGAAMLAGISCGWYNWTQSGKESLKALVQSNDRCFLPKMSPTEVQMRYLLWVDACDRVKL